MCENEKIEDFYKIDKVLGEGSFGIVKRATHKKTGEKFAIKMIKKENLGNDDLNALEQEIEIMQKIDHPNIVKLYDIFDDDNYFYMVLELMEGGELFERIVEKDHYSEKEAAETIRPIIDALRYCHEMEIAHRDLKPENLLYKQPGKFSEIKISDFGLARFINNEVMMTQCGTPGYVAPEIIKGKGYDVSIDWWSLGIILYIMLCGYPPFYDEDNEKLFDAISKCKYSFPEESWKNVSKEAKDLIKNLLTLDPKTRFTAKEILNHPWMKQQSDAELVGVPKLIQETNQQMKKLKGALKAVQFSVRLNQQSKKNQ